MITGIDEVLAAYAMGVFPMADSRDDPETFWVEPRLRGIIPLDKYNIPRSLKKFMKDCDYTVTFDRCFSDVIKACADIPRGHEKNTWINTEIESVFIELHEKGFAHSVEVWDENKLIGGLYGLANGGCFNGESMFSDAENASKIALVNLCEHLKMNGFTLLDTQFINDHLKQFGCIEIPQAEYISLLRNALKLHVSF